MKLRLFFGAAVLCLAASAATLRPPATPLVAHDPYFSVWSTADRLTDEVTKHWTGSEQPMTGLVRIDGQPFRFMGPPMRNAPLAQAMDQVARELTPTRTIYGFEAGGIRLDLTFMTPALPDDLDILSRPVTYLTWEARSTDGKPHAVTLYFDCSSLLAVNTPDQRVAWSRMRLPGMQALRAGSADQPVLAKSGDNLRIDWGYLYLAVPDQPGVEMAGTNPSARKTFIETGKLPESDDLDAALRIVLAATLDLGQVGSVPVARHLLLAYDDLFSIQYLQRNLRPYWRRNGWGASELLTAAAHEYGELNLRTRKFDDELTADLVKAGGEKYAAVATLAYRQTLAAHKLAADLDGTPLVLLQGELQQRLHRHGGRDLSVGALLPAVQSPAAEGAISARCSTTPRCRAGGSRSRRTTWAQYPLANGQVYGGGEKTEENQMPVEESGNMLILMAALARVEGNAGASREILAGAQQMGRVSQGEGPRSGEPALHGRFRRAPGAQHQPLDQGDPRAAFLRHARRDAGQEGAEAEYLAAAKEMAAKWGPMAADGDHYRLAFDKPGTWSQKYNLVWDKLLGLGLFPPEIARKEIAFYKTKQNAYGLPLDNREAYTKLDWIVWTATLADNAADFAALADPRVQVRQRDAHRVPLTDWYGTIDGKQRGFQARSVVGGVFIKLLEDPAIWKKWAGRGEPPPAAATQTAVFHNRSPLVQTPYTLLPLGSVKPAGWLERQLRIQAAGLTGHIEEFWPDLGPNSAWLGGTGEGWERGPYYPRRPGAAGLRTRRPEAGREGAKWMDWTLSNQRPDGAIGPAKNKDWWPNYVMLKALTQYQEATGDPRVIPLMEKYFAYMAANSTRGRSRSGRSSAGRTRCSACSGSTTATAIRKLLDLARKLHAQGHDWAGQFVDFAYKGKVAKADTSLKTHGVNNAQGLKTAAVWWQVSASKADLDGLYNQFAAAGPIPRTAQRHVQRRRALCRAASPVAGHGTVPGGGSHVLAREHPRSDWRCRIRRPVWRRSPTTRCPARSRRTCGRTSTTSRPTRCWSASPSATGRPTGRTRNIFGLEPNFGCCTANMHQGWPKLRGEPVDGDARRGPGRRGVRPQRSDRAGARRRERDDRRGHRISVPRTVRADGEPGVAGGVPARAADSGLGRRARASA